VTHAVSREGGRWVRARSRAPVGVNRGRPNRKYQPGRGHKHETRLKCRHISRSPDLRPDHRRHGTLQPGGATVPATAAAGARATRNPNRRTVPPRATIYRRAVAVGSVRLVLFSYSCARAHARDETWARRLSYPAAPPLVRLHTVPPSAASATVCSCYPLVERPSYMGEPLRRGDDFVPHRARAAAIAHAPSPQDSASCLAGTLPDTMLAPISSS
jgi:hypothetical protein